MKKDHPIVERKKKCPVCEEEFKEGDYLVLCPIQAHGKGGPRDFVVESIPVHRDCYWPVKCTHKNVTLAPDGKLAVCHDCKETFRPDMQEVGK